MTAVWYRAQAELRQHWRATVALALLVGLVGAVVLTVVAGARRSSTAYERFRETSRSADVQLETGFTADPALLDQVELLPQVEVVARVAVPLLRLAGVDLKPGFEFSSIASPDGSFPTKIDRVRVVQGREPDPARADEVGVSESVATTLNLGVGDEVTFRSLTPQQFEDLQNAAPFSPPRGQR